MPYEVTETVKRVWRIEDRDFVVQTDQKFEICRWYEIDAADMTKLHAVLGHILTDIAAQEVAQEMRDPFIPTVAGSKNEPF